jgi:hypothetical protein
VSDTAVDRHSLRQPFRGWVGGLSRRSLQNPLGALTGLTPLWKNPC